MGIITYQENMDFTTMSKEEIVAFYEAREKAAREASEEALRQEREKNQTALKRDAMSDTSSTADSESIESEEEEEEFFSTSEYVLDKEQAVEKMFQQVLEDCLEAIKLSQKAKSLKLVLGKKGPGFVQICGKTQSGKTLVIICIAFHCVEEEIIPVILVRNYTEDANQAENRFEQELNRFRQLTDSVFNLQVLRASGKKFRDEVASAYQAYKNGTGKLPVIVALANNSQIAKVNAAIDSLRADGIKVSLIIDENDALPKSRKTEGSALNKLDVLREKCQGEIGVTATPMSVFKNNLDITCEYCIELRPTVHYVGLSNVEFCKIEDDKVVSFGKAVTYAQMKEKDKHLHKFIDSFKEEIQVTDVQPAMALLNVTTYQQTQKNLYDGILREYDDKVIVILFNGTGITCSRSYDVKIKSRGKKNTKHCKRNRAAKTPGVGIGEVLQSLKVKYGNDHNIIIISGKKAGRCQTFASSDSYWRLSHMYYLTTKYMNLDEITHSVGRVTYSSRDKDELPRLVPKLCCRRSIANDIQKYNKLIEEFLHRAKSDVDRVDEPIFTTITHMPINSEKVPVGRDMSYNFDGSECNRVKGDCGFDISEYRDYNNTNWGAGAVPIITVLPASDGESESKTMEDQEDKEDQEFVPGTKITGKKFKREMQTKHTNMYVQITSWLYEHPFENSFKEIMKGINYTGDVGAFESSVKNGCGPGAGSGHIWSNDWANNMVTLTPEVLTFLSTFEF